MDRLRNNAVFVGVALLFGGVGCSSGGGSNGERLASGDAADTANVADTVTIDADDGSTDGELRDSIADGREVVDTVRALDTVGSDSADGEDAGEPAPTAVWTRFVGTGGADEILDVTVGADGELYVVGSVGEALGGESYNGGSSDAFVAEFDADGTRTWVRLLGSSAGDRAYAVGLAPSGGIYVAGTVSGAIEGHSYEGPRPDGFVAKYGPDGTRSWVRVLGESGLDGFGGLAVGSDGDVHLAGVTTNGLGQETFHGGKTDGLIATYDPLGTRKRLQLFGDVADESAAGITVDDEGTTYVAGRTNGDFGSERFAGADDVLVAAFDADGTRKWVDLIGGNRGDVGYDIALGGSGALYVSGGAIGSLDGEMSAGSGDGLVIKYDTSGTREWVRLVGSSRRDAFRSLAVDSADGVVVAGYAGGGVGGASFGGGSSDVLVGAFSSDGSTRWLTLLGGFEADRGLGIAEASESGLFVVGDAASSFDGAQFQGGATDGFVSKLK